MSICMHFINPSIDNVNIEVYKSEVMQSLIYDEYKDKYNNIKVNTATCNEDDKYVYCTVNVSAIDNYNSKLLKLEKKIKIIKQ